MRKRSKFCQKKHFDQLFVQLTAPKAGRKKASNTLSRALFVEGIVYIAARRHILPGSLKSLSLALEKLINESLWRMPSAALQLSDNFRRHAGQACDVQKKLV